MVSPPVTGDVCSNLIPNGESGSSTIVTSPPPNICASIAALTSGETLLSYIPFPKALEALINSANNPFLDVYKSTYSSNSFCFISGETSIFEMSCIMSIGSTKAPVPYFASRSA